jgi:hypothetical protein
MDTDSVLADRLDGHFHTTPQAAATSTACVLPGGRGGCYFHRLGGTNHSAISLHMRRRRGAHHDMPTGAWEEGTTVWPPEVTSTGTLCCHGEEYPWRHAM